MKQLRYLKTVELDKATIIKQDNGSRMETYFKVGDYRVQLQELTDEVSASIYGSDINRMYRVSSSRYRLENFLSGKNNNSADNVSLYSIVIGESRYMIRAVKEHWIDISLI